MNCTNALGFLGIGLAFIVAPFAAPALFPHTALDGSSTRALWAEVMGGTQVLVGAGFFLRRWLADATRGPETPATSAVGESLVASWDLSHPAIRAQSRAAEVAEVGAVTLRGEHAELWRALAQAIRADGDARHLATRLVEVATASAADGAQAVPENVVAFGGAEEHRTDDSESRVAM